MSASIIIDVDESTMKNNHKDKIRQIEEHYDQHHNTTIPKDLHRGDLHSNKRLLGYIDAMMATCATFLVLPLRNLHEMKENQSLEDFIHDVRLEFIIFFIGFFIVLTHWESINVRSFVIKRLDDFLVLLMVMSLLVVTGLPFSLSLQGHYSEELIPIVITSCLLIVFEMIEFSMICYATTTPRLLHLAMHKFTKMERLKFRNVMVIKCIVNIGLALLGGFLSIHNYIYSWIFMGLLILTPLLRKSINFVRRRCSKQTKMEKCHFFYLFTRGNVSKERVEAMSDAAIAIIACVLILDMTVEAFPTFEDVKKHGLAEALLHMQLELYAFLLEYVIVSLLWYTNHSVLHLFKTINVVLLYSQKIFLAFVCMLPLTSNMLTKFIKDNDKNTILSIRLTVLTIFIASLANFGMLVFGLYTKNKYLYEWAYGKNLKINAREHLYMIFKTVNMPVWAFICVLGTIASPEIAKVILFVCFAGMICSFLLFKVAFMNHCGKESLHKREETNDEDGQSSCTEKYTTDTKNDNDHVIDNGFENEAYDDIKDYDEEISDEEMNDFIEETHEAECMG